MKKSVIVILFLLLSVPLASPLLIKSYLVYIPGEMVGGVDGWLGFLGGYTGGLLAFISAYFIYRNDKLAREKTFLHISNSRDDSGEAPRAILTQRLIDQTEPKLVNIMALPFIEVIFEVKNVSNNFANDVQFKLPGKARAILWFHHSELNKYIEYESIALLEPSQSRVFRIKIDNRLVDNHDELYFELRSTNLFGQTTKQNIQLLLYKEAREYLFKHQT